MPIQILYEPGTELIVLFDENCKLKQKLLDIINSSKNIEELEISDFKKFVGEEFLEFCKNNFITCKSTKKFFYSEVCSLSEIKDVLVYLRKLYQEDNGDFFDTLKGNWRSFIK
ncbi:MAG: hypothetical protein PHR68_04765 [Candidatus Gracilibacteria bacterium]|nr:hypothetical protein [Candidatus Gracilibacteria bacterium]